jgi:hypothetical protein
VGVGVSNNGDGITDESIGLGSAGEDDAAGDGVVKLLGTAVGDAIGETVGRAGTVGAALGDGVERDSIDVSETDAVGIAEVVGDIVGEASTVSDIIGDVGGEVADEGVATIPVGLSDGVAADDCAAAGAGVSGGVGALVRIAFGVASLCGLGEVLAVGFGDGVGGAVGVGVGVGEAVGLSVGFGVGEGCSHATGQRIEISVAVWPARALSILAAGAKSPFAGSNSSVLARGL